MGLILTPLLKHFDVVDDDELSLYIKRFTPYLSKWYPYKKYGALPDLAKVVHFTYHKKYAGSVPAMHFCNEEYTRLIKTWISIHKNTIEDIARFEEL